MHRQRRPASGKVGGDILVSKLTCRRCHKIAEASDGRLPDGWWYTNSTRNFRSLGENRLAKIA
jgi:hypothetical protein